MVDLTFYYYIFVNQFLVMLICFYSPFFKHVNVFCYYNVGDMNNTDAIDFANV